MKQLLLVRHAKSDWGDPSLADFDRPLNGRGKSDAPAMADRLVKEKIEIDAFVSSPAKRAKKTACYFAKAFGEDKDAVVFKDELYGAGEDEFYSIISQLKNKINSVAIFSHNPGITDFANDLAVARIDNIPTSGVFAVKIYCDDWKDFKTAKKEFLFFYYPKDALFS